MANEVATAWVSVVPTAKGFGRELSGQVGGESSKVGKSLGGTFGKAFVAGGALAVGAGLGSFLKGAVDSASDLQEATSKTGVVFGKAADDILKFAEAGPKAFGQTKNEVLAAASTFGTFGKAAGLSGKDLSKFSTDFVSLSADLASFHNAEPQEAVEALGAALRGEAEPMRRFGVLLDDATMRQKALEMGLISTTKNALTPQQKTLAAQALIMEQTKDAQGDFARTSDGLANKQRILSATFGDLQTKIGGALLPAVTAIVGGMVSLLDTVSSLGPVVAPVGDLMQQGFARISPAIAQVVGTVRANLVPVLQTAAQTFQTVILPAVIRVGQYLLGNLVPIVRQVWAIFSGQLLPILSSVAQFVYGRVVPAVVGLVTSIGARLKPVLDVFFSTVQSRVLPAVSRFLSKLQEWGPTIGKVVVAVAKIVGKVLEFAAAILGKVLPPLIRFAGFLIGNVVGAVSAVIGVLVKIIGKVVDVGSAFVDGIKAVGRFVSAVSAKIGEAIGVVSGLKDKVLGAVSGAGRWLYDAGKKIIQGLIDGVSGMIGSLRDKFSEITNMIPDWKGPADKDARLLTPAGRLIMQGLIDGIEGKKGALKKTLLDLTDQISGTLDGLVKKTSKWAEKIDKAISLDKIGKKTKESLKGVAGDLDGLERRLGKAVDKLGGLRDAFTSLRDSVTSAFKVDLFSEENLSGFLSAGTNSINRLQSMLDAFATLRTAGASDEFLAGLFQSGNYALAAELAATPSNLAEAQRIWQTQENLAAQLGQAVASEVYSDEISAVQREVAALRTDVREAAKEAAAEFAKAINEAAANAKKGKGGGKKGGK